MAFDWQQTGRIVLVSIWALSGMPAAAQVLLPEPTEDEEPVEEVRFYSVEVIVFEYASNVSAGNEVFAPIEIPETEDVPLANDAAAGIPVFGDSAASAAGQQAGTETMEPVDFAEMAAEEVSELTLIPSLTDVEFTRLVPEELTMGEIHEQLLKLDAYLPVLWGGWSQSTHAMELTPSINLRSLGTPPLHIDGTLTLYLKNYLHLAVDVTREQHIASVQPVYRQEQLANYDQRSSDYGNFTQTNTQTIIYQILEDRLFNSGQLRYYDHPRFGVLARVNRVEKVAPEDEEELPGRPMLSRSQ